MAPRSAGFCAAPLVAASRVAKMICSRSSPSQPTPPVSAHAACTTLCTTQPYTLAVHAASATSSYKTRPKSRWKMVCCWLFTQTGLSYRKHKMRYKETDRVEQVGKASANRTPPCGRAVRTRLTCCSVLFVARHTAINLATVIDQNGTRFGFATDVVGVGEAHSYYRFGALRGLARRCLLRSSLTDIAAHTTTRNQPDPCTDYQTDDAALKARSRLGEGEMAQVKREDDQRQGKTYTTEDDSQGHR